MYAAEAVNAVEVVSYDTLVFEGLVGADCDEGLEAFEPGVRVWEVVF